MFDASHMNDMRKGMRLNLSPSLGINEGILLKYSEKIGLCAFYKYRGDL